VIEKGCGSHCLSGLRAKQQAKAKIKADAATAAQAKEEAKVAALQAKEDELEEKHTQWMYHNAGRAKKCFESDTGTSNPTLAHTMGTCANIAELSSRVFAGHMHVC